MYYNSFGISFGFLCVESNGNELTIGIAISKDIGKALFGEIGVCQEITLEFTNKLLIDFTTMIYTEIGLSLINYGYISIGAYKEINNINIILFIIIVLLSY